VYLSSSRFSPPAPSRHPCGCTSFTHPALTHGGSLIPPTLQILLSLSLPFGTFQDPGILKQVTSIWISRVCSVPGSYHFIIHLLFTLVHLHSFFCRLLCRISPFYSLFRPLSFAPKFSYHYTRILYNHLSAFIASPVPHHPATPSASCPWFSSYNIIRLHVFFYSSYHILHFIFPCGVHSHQDFVFHRRSSIVAYHGPLCIIHSRLCCSEYKTSLENLSDCLKLR
jgi:hypothetical protein